MEGEENKKRNIMIKVVKKWYENDKRKLIQLYRKLIELYQLSDEGAEQAERAERKAITTEDQMTDKATRTNTFNEILENIRYTHDKKNDDYKDSYSDTMKRFGTKSGLVRIYDKFNRIENILDSEGKANFESAEDNLQDLATYAIMMLEFLKKGGNK